MERKLNPEDARSQMIGLTKEGQALFERVFPMHLQHLEKAFSKLSEKELAEVTKSLQVINHIFTN